MRAEAVGLVFRYTPLEATCQEVSAALDSKPRDFPFAALYVLDDAGDVAALRAVVEPGGDARCPTAMDVAGEDHPTWPLRAVLRTRLPEEVSLSKTGVAVGGSVWPESVRHVMVIRVCTPCTNRSTSPV